MATHIFRTVNPFTEEIIKEYPLLSHQELEKRLEKAEHAYLSWRVQSMDFRISKLHKLAQGLDTRKSYLAKTATVEMGKPLKQAIAEVGKCISLINYYAENGEKFLKDYQVNDQDLKARVAFESLGVIYGIMPWNFPYWQAFRFAVPTLLAGNTVILKHAPSTMGSAHLIEEMFKEAGFAEGVYTNVVLDVDVTEKILSDARIKGVSLTGSSRAGKSVGELAGRHLKKSVLELGGSDPYLVLADADLDFAVDKCSQARMVNNGQSCVAAKRFIVHKSLVEEFIEKMKHNFSELQMGDPLLETTQLGPLARKDLKETLLKQIHRAEADGAHLELKLKTPEKGFFVAPQILTRVTPSNKSFHEELFGPAAMIFSFDKESEALALANATPFGLGGAVFSKDIEKAQQLARTGIQSGFVAVNDTVRSDPRLSFGGVKNSGYGRELGPFGLHEFVNKKTLNF